MDVNEKVDSLGKCNTYPIKAFRLFLQYRKKSEFNESHWLIKAEGFALVDYCGIVTDKQLEDVFKSNEITHYDLIEDFKFEFETLYRFETWNKYCNDEVCHYSIFFNFFKHYFK